MHLVLGGRWPRMHALRQLLEMTGGDPRKRNYAGKSPLSLAVEKGEAFEPAVALLQVRVRHRNACCVCVCVWVFMDGRPLSIGTSHPTDVQQ